MSTGGDVTHSEMESHQEEEPFESSPNMDHILDVDRDHGEILRYDHLTKGHIRILTLWPGDEHDHISGRLDNFPMDSLPPFDALSYCRGDQTHKYWISISDAHFEVAETLRKALQCLRHPTEPRRLWIDAICINQKDDQEKSWQVGMMRDIYRQATQTVVWVGEEDEDSRNAFAACKQLVESGTVVNAESLEPLFVEFSKRRTLQIMADEPDVLGTMTESEKNEYLQGKIQQEMAQRADSSRVVGHMTLEQVRDALLAGLDSDVIVDLESIQPLIFEFGKRRTEEIMEAEKEILEKMTEDEMDEYLEGRIDRELDERIDFARLVGHMSLDQVRAALFGESECIDKENRPQDPDKSESTLHIESDHEDAADEYQGATESAEHSDAKSAIDGDGWNWGDWKEGAALHELFKRPWFNRIWIIQELGVSERATVQCGRDSMDWGDLYAGYQIIAHQQPATLVGPAHIRNVSYMSQTKSSIAIADASPADKSQLELLRLLRRYRSCDGTDKRDKVFALLGMTTSNLDEVGLRPDYTRNVEDTYVHVAAALLEASENLDLLAVPKGQGDLAERLPSWVPDWSDTGTQPWWLAGDYASQDSKTAGYAMRVFSASGESVRPPLEWEIDKRRLCLDGYTMDQLREVGPVFSAEDETMDSVGFLLVIWSTLNAEDDDDDTKGARPLEKLKEFFSAFNVVKTVQEWERIANVDNDEIAYRTGEDNLTVYQMTLWADMELPPGNVSAMDQFLAWRTRINMWSEMLKDLSLDGVEPNMDALSSFLDKVMERISAFRAAEPQVHGASQVHIRGRRLARTGSGLLGLVPATAQVGDQICLLKGGSTPYVVRARKCGWELVGDTYVHGIMYGEDWDGQSCVKMDLL